MAANQFFNIPLFIHFQYLTDYNIIFWKNPTNLVFIYLKSKISSRQVTAAATGAVSAARVTARSCQLHARRYRVAVCVRARVGLGWQSRDVILGCH